MIEHLKEVFDYFVQINIDNPRKVLTAEGEELSRKIHCTECGCIYMFKDAGSIRITFSCSFNTDRTEIPDGSQYVAKVVGYSACKSSYSLHLLGVQELRLQPLTGLFRLQQFGDVGND